MAGVLNAIYTVAAVLVSLSGLWVVVTRTDDPEGASNEYLSELTALAVGVFVVGLGWTMLA